MAMNILVTGGSGFLGAWVTRHLLAAGMTPRLFDLQDDRRMQREIVGEQADRLEWLVGDVTDRTAVEAALRDCQGVIHLAGLLMPACRDHPLLGARVNLLGSLNVFEAAIAGGLPKVVYSSTAGVFGPDDGTTPYPLTHYGAFKLAVEGAARAYWQDRGLASIGFRPFIVYGPGRETGASAGPSVACRAAVRGEDCTIGFSGATGFVYVEDVAAAFVRGVTAPLPGARVFNLVGEIASVEQVIAEIRRQVPGARLAASGPKLPIAADLSEADLRLALPELPRTALRDGLAATLAHYRRQRPEVMS